MRRPKIAEQRRRVHRNKSSSSVQQTHSKHPKSRLAAKHGLLSQMRTKLKLNRKTVANMSSITAAAVGVALAEVVGVGELVIGAAFAYATYRVIRYRMSPSKAIMEGMEMGQDEVGRRSSHVA